jgi:hypothetical protein
MARRSNRRWGLWATLVIAALAGGCGWRELQHDELFGADAGMADADGSVPVDADASGPVDAELDQANDVVAPDAPDAQVDTVPFETLPPIDASIPCTPTSCATGEFCDDLTGHCLPNQGTGMLSGVVYEICQHRSVQARIGIAGQHQCAVDQKGSYYFRSALPVGLLTLSAYAEGYKVFSITVDVKAIGTTQDIAMTPDTPNGCADAPPAPVSCVCTISGCPGVP